ncbi:MAG: hypothetical protein SWQ30_20595 [Thermodesulfobacteriota bacterium]|nr:hypothetical protein [Thermodesulfobacteriota bacterium]
MNPKNAHGVSDWTFCETLFEELLKALEAEEKRISPSRGFHYRGKAKAVLCRFVEALAHVRCCFVGLIRVRNLTTYDESMSCPSYLWHGMQG